MSPKTSKPIKKVEKKSSEKSAPKAEKSSKKQLTAEVQAAPAGEQAALGEDAEDMDFEEDSAPAASSGPKMDEDGMLALAGRTGAEGSSSFKNFRHHPDMENFYRFVYENDLRYEALGIIDQILAEKIARREVKALKTKAH